MKREQPRFCKKDGKRLVVRPSGQFLWLECPSIRKWWLPGISTDWDSHTSVYIGDAPPKFDVHTGERVR